MRCADMDSSRFVSGLLAGLLGLTLSSAALASLQGRDVDGVAANGFEAYYDTVLNITWLADANYAQTSGSVSGGKLTWDAANSWAQGLSYFGITGWRLPHFEPVNGVSVSARSTLDGSTDAAYNIDSSSNELAYMYYTNLGLLAPVTPDWQFRTSYGLANGSVQVIPGVPGGKIVNLNSDFYWSNVAFSQDPAKAWGLWTKGSFAGYHAPDAKTYDHFAWAVHDGDPFKVDVVTSTPTVSEPSTGWLIMAGLGMGAYITRGRKKARVSQPYAV